MALLEELGGVQAALPSSKFAVANPLAECRLRQIAAVGDHPCSAIERLTEACRWA
jgi:hypothetical protein